MRIRLSPGLLTGMIALLIASVNMLIDVMPPQYGWPLFAVGFVTTAVSLRLASGSRWPLRRQPPRELPELPDAFRGRDRELAEMIAAHDHWDRKRAPATVFIQGPPRIGKAVMAARLARRLAGKYADGVLHFDLKYAGERVVADALRHFLTQLGWPPGPEEFTVDTLQAALRKRIRGRRILFVVLRARQVGQVQKLLPNEPGCGLVVTSRAVLAPSLQRPQIRLEEPDAVTSAEIVLALANDVAADADSLAVVLERTRRYPPALVEAGQSAFAQNGLGWVAATYGNGSYETTTVPGSVADLTEGYQEEYLRLNDEERHAYELLSLVPAQTFVPWVLRPLSAGVGRPIEHVTATLTLSNLAAAGLLIAIDSADAGIRKCFPRYRFPPLARQHAARRLEARGEVEGARRALRHAVLLAACEVMGIQVERPPEAVGWMPQEEGWQDGIKASESFWVRAEHANLAEAAVLAGELGEPDACAGLAIRLGGIVGAPVTTRAMMAALFAAARACAGSGRTRWPRPSSPTRWPWRSTPPRSSRRTTCWRPGYGGRRSCG
ncbi:hypothetical protein OIE66_12930 [Nonomuraea sp. NBC_01738]|uniref:hypothetical protein n=1 Tax=Nonomuraea sp. NBC_01738 TaxID=2976003 RepID=UPI002E0E5DF8|nr:hypothetical protein OIE66_12930 [Nonomuraea sp. NBC_01738]